MTGGRVWSVLAGLILVVLVMGFAALNGSQHVTLRLGFVTLYYVPLTAVAFGGLVAGMLIMFVAGIRSDLRVRRILRERLADEAREAQSRVDRNQVDLFGLTGDSTPHRSRSDVPHDGG
jgi:uncharacterized integral membrane protein